MASTKISTARSRNAPPLRDSRNAPPLRDSRNAPPLRDSRNAPPRAGFHDHDAPLGDRELTDDELDRLFGALSHRVRRAMVARLRRGPATVGELAAPHAMSPPAISKHLRILEQAGLVARTIDGRVHHCQLDAHALENIDAWLAHYRGFWTDSLEALARHVEKA